MPFFILNDKTKTQINKANRKQMNMLRLPYEKNNTTLFNIV